MDTATQTKVSALCGAYSQKQDQMAELQEQINTLADECSGIAGQVKEIALTANGGSSTKFPLGDQFFQVATRNGLHFIRKYTLPTKKAE